MAKYDQENKSQVIIIYILMNYVDHFWCLTTKANKFTLDHKINTWKNSENGNALLM